MSGESGKTLPQKLVAIGVTIAVLVFCAVLFYKGSQPTVYSIENGNFVISTEYGQTIKLSNIKGIEVKDGLPANLSRTNGYGIGNILKGHCSSNIGNVDVYVDTSKPPFLYLSTTSGVVIINGQSKAETQALYDKLNSAIGKK